MRGSRENQGLDSLRSIHKDCKTTYKAPLVQLINKEVSGGRPEAVTLSDGLSVSPNVDPLTHFPQRGLNLKSCLLPISLQEPLKHLTQIFLTSPCGEKALFLTTEG